MSTHEVLAFARTLPDVRETYLMRRVTLRAHRRSFLVFAQDGDAVIRMPKAEHEALQAGFPHAFTPASSHTWLKVNLAVVTLDAIEYLVTRAWQATLPNRNAERAPAIGALSHAAGVVHGNGYGMLLDPPTTTDSEPHGISAR